MAPFLGQKAEAQTDGLTYSKLSQVCRTPESGFFLLGNCGRAPSEPWALEAAIFAVLLPIAVFFLGS